MAALKTIILVEGVRGAIAVGAWVIVAAILGLSPGMTWVPEVPLVLAAILVPVVGYCVVGRRSADRSGRAWAGAVAGGLAGAISGATGGVAYVAFGKPALNVLVGLFLGSAVGAFFGGVAALLRQRPSRHQDLPPRG